MLLTELYESCLKGLGVDTETLPDKLEVTYLKAIAEACGCDVSETETLQQTMLMAVAENIATAASGGASPVVVSHTFTASDEQTYSFDHGLGVVPDIVILHCGRDSFSPGHVVFACGVSRAAYNAGIEFVAKCNYLMGLAADGSSFYDNSSFSVRYCIDETKPTDSYSWYTPIYADATVVTFNGNGRGSPMFSTGKKYTAYIIGGLT